MNLVARMRIYFAVAIAIAQPKTAAVIMTTGASPNRDGLYSIRISGTLGATKRFAQDCGAS